MKVVHAQKILEYPFVIERLLKCCETPLGETLANDLAPCFDEEDVWVALEETGEARRLFAEASPPSLGAVRDLRNAVKRASAGGLLGGEELYAVGEALAAMRAM